MKGTVDEYLKMSVLNGVLTLKDYKTSYPDKTFDEIVELIRNIGSYQSTYDYLHALEYLRHTDLNLIHDLKSVINDIIIRLSPSWMQQIPFGRKVVETCLLDNEKYDVLQCLQSAGLYVKNPDDEVINWWDRLSSIVRSADNDLRLESGRQGELLTLEYERKRLEEKDVKPKWMSIENNLAGYDVLSYSEESSGLKQKLIEVKASKSRPVVFYLSRNEWNCAVNFGESYFFHIWYLPSRKLIELSVSDIEKNIPINQGSGEWKTVMINIDKDCN